MINKCSNFQILDPFQMYSYVNYVNWVCFECLRFRFRLSLSVNN